MEFCAQHARAGMVNIKGKKCCHDNCSRVPSYGVAGSGKSEFCAQHARAEMVDVKHKRCGTNGCARRIAYSVTRSGKGELCRQHASEAAAVSSTTEHVQESDTFDSSPTENEVDSIGSVRGRKYCSHGADTHRGDSINEKSDRKGCANGERRGSTTPLITGLSKRSTDVDTGEEACVKLELNLDYFRRSVDGVRKRSIPPASFHTNGLGARSDSRTDPNAKRDHKGSPVVSAQFSGIDEMVSREAGSKVKFDWSVSEPSNYFF